MNWHFCKVFWLHDSGSLLSGGIEIMRKSQRSLDRGPTKVKGAWTEVRQSHQSGCNAIHIFGFPKKLPPPSMDQTFEKLVRYGWE